MKKIFVLILISSVFMFFTSCASVMPVGMAYTKVKLPVIATSNSIENAKVGTAECTSYLGLVAIGDASIEAAKKQGKITKVDHIDWEAQSILGIIGHYKLIVYGK